MPSNHLILCRPLLLLPSIFPSIRVFSNESALRIRWPSFSFSISPSNEYPGLISFRMDWLDLLAVQGTLKSLLQNHSSKSSVLQCSALFTVQLSHPKKLGDRCHRGPQPLPPGGLEVCEGVCASHHDRGTSSGSHLSLRHGVGLQICLLKMPKASL